MISSMSTRALVIVSLVFAGACRKNASSPSEPQQPRPVSGPCSQLDAEDLYRAEAYAEAAWMFAEVLAGRCPRQTDNPEQRLEFWLAKSRHQIADYRGACSW